MITRFSSNFRRYARTQGLRSIAVTPELRDCARSNVTPELRDCQSSYPLPFWLIVHYSYFGPSMQNACIQIRICKSWQVSWPYGQVTCVVADHSFKLSTVEKAKPNEGTHMISSCHGEPFHRPSLMAFGTTSRRRTLATF